MLTLVIDSATEACSVGLLRDGDVIASDYRMLGRGHAELLVPMIAALPGKGQADRIAVALGPGSFTGVRVGIAAARALAFAWGAELVGYPTLALVAAMARAERPGAPVAVAMTGGHGEWFVQSFAPDGAELSALASSTPDEAIRTVGEAFVAGSQAQALVDARGHGAGLPLWPDARAFDLLSATAIRREVHPLYGRAPDARLPQGAA